MSYSRNTYKKSDDLDKLLAKYGPKKDFGYEKFGYNKFGAAYKDSYDDLDALLAKYGVKTNARSPRRSYHRQFGAGIDDLVSAATLAPSTTTQTVTPAGTYYSDCDSCWYNHHYYQAWL